MSEKCTIREHWYTEEQVELRCKTHGDEWPAMLGWGACKGNTSRPTVEDGY